MDDPARTRRVSPEVIDRLKAAFPDGATFIVSPSLRWDLQADGLENHGLEFCHELAGDGRHELEAGIFGQHLRFKGAVHVQKTDAEKKADAEATAPDEPETTSFPGQYRGY